jgi:uncharacterized protein involved in exopolysaccharide biosynthesis
MNETGFYLRAARRGWWLALLVLVACVAVAGWLAARESPVYKSSASLVATPSSRLEANDEILDAIEGLERRTVLATFAKIPPASETRDSAARRLDLPPDDLRYYWVGAYVLPNTNVIRIDVVGPDPERTAEVADAVASETREEARSLYGVYTLRRLARAEVADEPERPDPKRSAAIGGVVGLFLAALAALALEAARSRSA